MKITFLLLAIIVAVGGLVLFRKTSFTTLDSKQLSAMLAKKDFVFINVHIPYEGEIKETDLFIPYNKISENISKLPQNKNTKIVLYCQSGRMSEEAAVKLIDMGYTNVSHLSGGMRAWQASGFEIIKKP